MNLRTIVRVLLCTASLVGAAATTGCEPTPDYKIVALDIPASAALLLVGWKGDSDTVAHTSMAVPVGQLDPGGRQHYSIGLSLADAPDSSGVLSIATVDQNGCVSSVVNAGEASRSSGGGVTTVQIELDPSLNPDVVPVNPAYASPMSCPKVSGLTTLPTEPTPVSAKPVFINAVRELNGPAGVFDSGRIRLHGWGLGRGSVAVLVNYDPQMCFLQLATTAQQNYSQYVAALMGNSLTFQYPTLSLQSYAELDLQVEQIKAVIKPMPAPSFLLNGLIKCIAVSALSFSFTGQDGSKASFIEVLPSM